VLAHVVGTRKGDVMAECNGSTVKFDITLDDQEVLDLLSALDTSVRQQSDAMVAEAGAGGMIGYRHGKLKATTMLRDFFLALCQEHSI
jgi:hypothetical protein